MSHGKYSFFILAVTIGMVAHATTCVEEEHLYMCSALDEEAEELSCTACYPIEEEGHYNCSCWVSLEEELLDPLYSSCQDAFNKGQTTSGVYALQPDNLPAFEAYCDMETDGGGWTVFQRRMDGSEDFYLGWKDYVHGFGNVSREHWLGLSKIYRLANSSTPQQLRVDLQNFLGLQAYAVYESFFIGGESMDYVLNVRGYNGTAGDSMAYHDNSKFTTKDRNNDNDPRDSSTDPASGGNCAIRHHGAWWYNYCARSNLNGRYFTDIFWVDWEGFINLSYTEMKVRYNPPD